MGWARSAWMAVVLLAFAAGNATAAEPKRVLLLHSFGPDFRAEEIFARLSAYGFGREIALSAGHLRRFARDRALYGTASETRPSRAIGEPFSPAILPT